MFNQSNHTYLNTQTGVWLNGITSTLIKRVDPDKYAGIPQNILENAAKRGSLVHEDIELAETMGTEPSTDEGKAYLKLKERAGLSFFQSEYLVSDLEHYATNIDVIYSAGENIVDIADFKTTYKFDNNSVSWQLSICAYLFEMNNPHIHVRKLYGIWLRGDKAELIEVRRKPNCCIEQLIEADLLDIPFNYSPEFPEYIMESEQRLYTLSKRIKELETEYDNLKAEVLEAMIKNGDKTFDVGHMVITMVAPQTRESFDSKKFKSEHQELYNEYIKKTTTKPSLKLTIR